MVGAVQENRTGMEVRIVRGRNSGAKISRPASTSSAAELGGPAAQHRKAKHGPQAHPAHADAAEAYEPVRREHGARCRLRRRRPLCRA